MVSLGGWYSSFLVLGLGSSVLIGPCVEIGQPLNEACLKRVKGRDQMVLVTPSQLEPGFEFYYQTVRYTGVVKRGHFVFLSTIDARFRTPEGVSPGMTLSQLHLLPSRVHLIPGWAQVYQLPSGWQCGFAFDSKLGAASKIQFLYKN